MPESTTMSAPPEISELWDLLIQSSIMSENHNELMDDLKSKRKEMNVSDEEFSELSNIPVDAIDRFENGDGEILLSDLRCYALALGVTFQTDITYIQPS